MTKTRPALTIETGREETKTAAELHVRDLWHLARAFPKLEEGIKKAKAHLLEEELGDCEIVLNELAVPDGESAAEAVLEVWHLAHSSTKALQRIEGQLHQLLELTEATLSNPSLNHDVRTIALAALKGQA